MVLLGLYLYKNNPQRFKNFSEVGFIVGFGLCIALAVFAIKLGSYLFFTLSQLAVLVAVFKKRNVNFIYRALYLTSLIIFLFAVFFFLEFFARTSRSPQAKYLLWVTPIIFVASASFATLKIAEIILNKLKLRRNKNTQAK
jgi:glucose dehydrogenase